MRQQHRYLAIRVILFSVALWVWLSAFAAPYAFAQSSRKLRVGVLVAAPFVIQTADHFTGYSIDYWEKVAAAMGWSFEYVPVDTQEQVVSMLNDGSLDVVIGAIGMTPEREQIVDFSHPYFMSGLQILVPTSQSKSVFSVFAPLIDSAVLQVFIVAIIFAVIMAHVIYLVEHFGKNPDFQQGYLRDIWEAFWYLLIIVATGEYGDKEARAPIKRIVTVAFWLLGIVFIAQFTAAATSSLTVQQLRGTIDGLSDLPGKRLITLANSVAADFLILNKIPFTTVANVDDGYAQLEQGQADAFVFQAPVLQYFASNAGNSKVQVVGPVFAPLPIGMVVKTNSPLRKPISETVLKFYQDGTYKEINARWFGDTS
jgi:polar amino acid transport system substrate-binding protein